MKYSEKKGRPFIYDRSSKEFQAGAWKNLSPEEAERNRRAIRRD